jgi:hypothetical protein
MGSMHDIIIVNKHTESSRQYRFFEACFFAIMESALIFTSEERRLYLSLFARLIELFIHSFAFLCFLAYNFFYKAD